MVKEIICVSGEIALCDDQDYPLLSRFTWYMGSNLAVVGYPCCFLYKKNRDYIRIFMHQLVSGGSITVDHIDLDKLNNQSSNLRAATKNENEWNKAKQKTMNGKPCTSKYKGVSLQHGKWKAQITRNGTFYDLGSYNNEEAAAFFRLITEFQIVSLNTHYKRRRIFSENKAVTIWPLN